jgi:hypothetical protein
MSPPETFTAPPAMYYGRRPQRKTATRGDLLERGESAEGYPRKVPLRSRSELVLGHVGHHEAGGEGVHGDPEGGRFPRERDGKGDQAALGGIIGCLAASSSSGATVSANPSGPIPRTRAFRISPRGSRERSFTTHERGSAIAATLASRSPTSTARLSRTARAGMSTHGAMAPG